MVKKKEPKDEIVLAMNYNSNVALGIAHKDSVSYIRIMPDGLVADTVGRESFLREFYRDLLQEEWPSLVKFWYFAVAKPNNEQNAIALLTRMFNMKLADLKGKSMTELVEMHNELAKAQGAKEVTKFKTIEAARIAVAKLSNVKAAPKVKEAKATGGGAPGRPRLGVGKFAKEQLLKGLSNTEVLEAVKKQFPNNATTLNCIAYYRAHMIKDGTLAPKPKAEKKAKAEKAEKPTKGKKAKKEPAEATA